MKPAAARTWRIDWTIVAGLAMLGARTGSLEDAGKMHTRREQHRIFFVLTIFPELY